MKYQVKNLRTGETIIYDELDRAECFVRISVMVGNDRRFTKSEKRWSKRDFEIIEILSN